MCVWLRRGSLFLRWGLQRRRAWLRGGSGFLVCGTPCACIGAPCDCVGQQDCWVLLSEHPLCIHRCQLDTEGRWVRLVLGVLKMM